MRVVELDPLPAAKLDTLHAMLPQVAAAMEECLDWIEADPVDSRAKRRGFTNGIWAILRSAAGSDWLVLWDEDEPGHPVVRFIGETASP